MSRLPVKHLSKVQTFFVELGYCKFGYIKGQANIGGIVFYKHRLSFLVVSL